MEIIIKERSIDCSEIVEKLEGAADGDGGLTELKSGLTNELNILENGVVERNMIYHQVCTDGRYIYDPRLSANAISKGDWVQHIKSLNPEGVTISDKLRGLNEKFIWGKTFRR